MAKLQELDWNDLRYVLAVARTGTYSSAARRLSVNESTVARRLSRIDEAIGTLLFHRTGGVLIATESGAMAIAAAERIENEAESLLEAISDSDQAVAGLVRVTSVPIVLNRLLIPALPALLSSHPALHLELVAEPRDLSLTRREADIAIRMARPTRESTIVARRIGELEYATYWRRDDNPDVMPWINFDGAMQSLPQARWIQDRLTESAADCVVSFNDTESICYALKAGVGKSLLPTFLGDREPDLVRSGGRAALTRELWLLVHPDLRHLVRIRTVMAWITALVSAASPMRKLA